MHGESNVGGEREGRAVDALPCLLLGSLCNDEL